MLPESPPPPMYIHNIGDIGITNDGRIVTPNGQAPLAGSVWLGRDLTRVERVTPTWAIVMAIIFAFACLIGLFFLLVKENRVSGYFEVSVRSGDLYHVSQLPVHNLDQIPMVMNGVSYAQTLATREGIPPQGGGSGGPPTQPGPGL